MKVFDINKYLGVYDIMKVVIDEYSYRKGLEKKKKGKIRRIINKVVKYRYVR